LFGIVYLSEYNNWEMLVPTGFTSEYKLERPAIKTALILCTKKERRNPVNRPVSFCVELKNSTVGAAVEEEVEPSHRSAPFIVGVGSEVWAVTVSAPDTLTILPEGARQYDLFSPERVVILTITSPECRFTVGNWR
jgi:hypothetical protein